VFLEPFLSLIRGVKATVKSHKGCRAFRMWLRAHVPLFSALCHGSWDGRIALSAHQERPGTRQERVTVR